MVKIIEQFFSEPYYYTQLGFSVIGNGKDENQDHFDFFHNENCVIAVMADGLGSAIYSSHGSKILCTTAIEILKETDNAMLLANQILEKWLSNLEHKPTACDSTLKFIKITNEKAIMGGVGDGWITFLSNNEYLSLTAENSFANQTNTILSDLKSKFIIKEISLKEDFIFLLATDGFSEDIEKIMGKKFLSSINESLDKDIHEFCANLENTLNNWPVITNYDDKSVVIIKRGLRK